MTLILLNDIETVFSSILVAFVPLIIPIIVVAIFFHFTRDILFKN